jgi:hypothetical protein
MQKSIHSFKLICIGHWANVWMGLELKQKVPQRRIV